MRADIEREEWGRDPWADRLSDYLDGELTPAERAALETHLAACAACTETLEALRAVVSHARTLEDAPPAEDLWPGIEAQISREIASAVAPSPEPRGRAPIIGIGRLWWTRRFDVSIPQLAAAAVLLVALSAGAVWIALRGSVPAPAPATAPLRHASRSPDAIAAAPARPLPAPASDRPMDATPVVAGPSNPRYDAAIAQLETALAEGRGQLDPRTLRVVEQNLRTIDRALEQARRAVAADPGNLWLRSHLAATMKQKVDLLRTATLLTAAQG
jgi:anti-sigma factor RsiW